MAKSRRKAGGATSGRYKPKKMGKGWSAYRDRLGFRPPVIPNEPSTGGGSEGSSKKSGPQPAADGE